MHRVVPVEFSLLLTLEKFDGMKSVLRHFSSATLIGVVLFIIFQVIYFFNGRSLVINEAFWIGLLEHMIFS